MGERRFAHAGDVLEEEMAAGQQADHRHLDDGVLSLDDAGDIILDGPDGIR